jgi:DNA-binding MarR family transcriptional regulator
MPLPHELSALRGGLNVITAASDHNITDLTPRQLLVLLALRDASPKPMRTGEIADALSVSKPVVTRAIDRLVAEGWVRNVRGQAADRRVNDATLTPSGLAIMDEVGRGMAAAARGDTQAKAKKRAA